MNTPSRTASNSRANASARVCAATERDDFAMEPMVSRRGGGDKKASHTPITREGTPGAQHHMRIFGRNDVFLLGGSAIAVWVVSSRQLGTLLDRAREIDHS